MFTCFYCGRLMKYQVPHKCKDGFRKRKLKFEEYDKPIFLGPTPPLAFISLANLILSSLFMYAFLKLLPYTI